MKSLDTYETPFYKKLAFVLFCLMAIGYLALLGKKLLAPLLFSMLFAIVLLPVAKFFELRFKLPRALSSLFSLVLFIAFLGSIFYLVGSQVSNLASDWPQFKEQLNNSLQTLKDWVESNFHINPRKQVKYINDASSSVLSSGSEIVSTTFFSLSSVMLFLVFTMIDIFFLLMYRRLILHFLIAVFKKEDSHIVYSIVEEVQTIIRKYIIGLLLEMAIVTTLVFLAFWILGIKYAILLGLLTGMLNLIPYLGIFTALIISSLITFATAAAVTKVLIVAVVLFATHLIDANILLPLVVASKVKINALITILGVILGEMIWGIPGMFLSIPVIAIIKIIFDRVESLQPWGMLLGEESKENKVTVAKDEY